MASANGMDTLKLTSSSTEEPSLDSMEACIEYLENKGLSNEAASAICQLYFPPNETYLVENMFQQGALVSFTDHPNSDKWHQFIDDFYKRFNILSTFGKESPDGKNILHINTMAHLITQIFEPDTTSNADFQDFMEKAYMLKSIGIEPDKALYYAYNYCERNYFYNCDRAVLEFFFQNFTLKIQPWDFSSFDSMNHIMSHLFHKNLSISIATEICEKAARFTSIGIKPYMALDCAYTFCKRNSNGAYDEEKIKAYFEDLTSRVEFLLSLPPVRARIEIYL
jgi:hypothetical protein